MPIRAGCLKPGVCCCGGAQLVDTIVTRHVVLPDDTLPRLAFK